VKRHFKQMVMGAVMVSALAAAPAQAGCWSVDAIEAAKVRDMETMLMVSALRCRASGHDFMGKYNHFIRSSRASLMVANDRLRHHFANGVGGVAGLNAYDRYATSLANRYGAGADGLNCRDMASIADAALREGHSFDGLSRLATRAEIEPELHGPRCPVVVARAR
jgi:hypothetical protein